MNKNDYRKDVNGEDFSIIDYRVLLLQLTAYVESFERGEISDLYYKTLLREIVAEFYKKEEYVKAEKEHVQACEEAS